MVDEDIERIASGYRAFADEAATESPLYSRLASAGADDGDVLRFLAGLPEAERQPALFFAAVQVLHGAPADPAELGGVVTRNGPAVGGHHAGACHPDRRARALWTPRPGRSGDRGWLRALVWPGPRAADRLARLDAAAAIAAREPARVLRGDLSDRLPEAVALLPEDGTAVVLHTAVLPYLPPAGRAASSELVRSLPVCWIAQEPRCHPGTGGPLPGGWGPEFVLSLDGRPVARTAHGGRIAWLDEP